MTAISDKYDQLGGPAGLLGGATTGELPTPDGIGRFTHYQAGSIYWTPDTGAHEVHGDIRSKWQSLGWETSPLGYPVTDETPAPDGVGRFNRFQGGFIDWTVDTGAHEVHGDRPDARLPDDHPRGGLAGVRPHQRSDAPIEILLVEDSAGDAELTRIALRDAKVANRLHIVRDGQAAMDFLRQVGRFSAAPRPDLILLDLNLPRKSGHEILAEVRQDPQLELIPIVVLTTSSDEHDVFRSYGLRANAYITKPLDFGQFRKGYMPY